MYKQDKKEVVFYAKFSLAVMELHSRGKKKDQCRHHHHHHYITGPMKQKLTLHVTHLGETIKVENIGHCHERGKFISL